MSQNFYDSVDRAIRLLREARGEADAIGYAPGDKDNKIVLQVKQKLRAVSDLALSASFSLEKFIK